MNERQGLVCSDTPAGAGCTNKQGAVVVPFMYAIVECCESGRLYFAESGLALVLHPKDGWVYIDRHNRRFGQALTLDARPDEVFGGFARFRAANGKIGYLDQKRHVVIPPRYDSAFPFARCTAKVCVGCHPDRWDQDAPPEAECTGEAFMIDESGKRLKEKLPDDEYCAEKRNAATKK